MSPIEMYLDETVSRFPRVSGDEPETVTVTAPPVEFSPRERG